MTVAPIFCLASPTASLAAGRFPAPAAVDNDRVEEANLALVRRFYADVLTPLDAGAVDALVAPDYIQHDPAVPSGAAGLKAMLEVGRARYGRVEHRVKRMIAKGDLVVAHVNAIFEPSTRGVAVVDIFRIAHGRIVEHWDVVQPVPEAAKNANTMF